MRLTVLTDDNIGKSRRLLAEHGLCFYIESEGKKILFDTGSSDVFIQNSLILGINLLDLDYIILSHGHYDHTWGLVDYIKFYTAALKRGRILKKPLIITHPDTFLEKFDENEGEIGCLVTKKKLEKNFQVKTTTSPLKITEELTFLGEVERANDFEAKTPLDKVLKGGAYQDDYLLEDSALVFKSDGKISVITGCSHSGICNIVEYAKKVSKCSAVNFVIGGFHLLDEKRPKIEQIIEHLKAQNIEKFYPCHCTGDLAKKLFAEKLNTELIGVGFVLI